ncbi:MAG: ComF family protein [Legionellaceae bacterium]|nr:ComF family protein [Legionellaceae bacterium]
MRALIKTSSIPHEWHLRTPCNLCLQNHTARTSLCYFCESLLIPLGAACRQCATPLPDTNLTLCGQCIKHPPPIDVVVAPYRFEEPLRTLLHLFKYHEALHLSHFLAEKIRAAAAPITKAKTCLIPVPLHPKKLQKRGFNQAAVLTQHLSKTCGLPALLHHIKKIKNTPPQAALEAKSRQKNIKDSFNVPSIPYSHVILVDDLITTGSTANELARALKLKGVKTVHVWCIAKTCLE